VSSALDESLGWLLNNAARLMQRRFSTKLAPHRVTPPQWGVLVALWEQDGLSLSELAHRSFFDGPTMTGIVDRLEHGGMVERRRDSQDRRVISVYLTDAGRALEAVLPDLSDETNVEAVAGLTDAQVEQLRALLQQIVKNLETPASENQ
jgi:MarR family transcriptional regulator, organic hydroperoxide resistance regulator